MKKDCLVPSNHVPVLDIRVVNRARTFRVRSSSGRARAWILKNCLASILPDARAKSRFSVSDKIFAINGIKQREHLVHNRCCSLTGVTWDE